MGKFFWLCIGNIVYTYLGYPLLLILLAQLRSKPRRYQPATPAVTLLIAAHNEQAVIAEKLDNCLALDYPRERLQILVAADGSNDRTPEIVQGYVENGVELSYSPPRRGKMAAINRAMAQARGEIVVFSDANNMYEAHTLRELVTPFADMTVGAVTGAKSIMRGDGALGESEGLYWRYESFIKEQETRLGCCTGVAGEVLAIRRDLFEQPPDNIINDDFYLALRLIQRGHRVIYTPQARSWERVSLSAGDEMTRRARIVAGRYQAMALAPRLLPLRQPLLVWQVVSHKFLRPLVPLAMIGALLSNLATVLRPPQSGKRVLLRLGPPFNRIMLLGQLLFYGLAWLGQKSKRQGRLAKLLYLPAFLVNSNLAALIGLYRSVTGGQTTLWQRAQRREGTRPEGS
ncbi:MAG: glycosyltransferase family 2 protein [Anaerolineales bacterium]|nr:glycosyltransferase family 2 protein [Anaerolineales bacterium]